MRIPNPYAPRSSGQRGLCTREILNFEGGWENARGGGLAFFAYCLRAELQLRHSTRKLLGSLVPPMDRGSMWSTVKSKVKPQNEHQGCDSRISLEILRHSLLYPRLEADNLLPPGVDWHLAHLAAPCMRTPHTVQGLVILVIVIIVTTKNVVYNAHALLLWERHVNIES